jgi:hypothetical protein|tara:strand:+ start:5552 stop:6475 length:924 start_codon:yes stop_codon:yes gene_type:complete
MTIRKFRNIVLLFIVILILIIVGCKKNNPFEACEQINNKIDRNNCYRDLIGTVHDPELCFKFVDAQVFSSECFIEIGKHTEKLKYCDEIEEGYYNYKDKCITGIAVEKKDLDICNKVPDKSFVGWCKNEVAIKLQNPEICTSLTGLHKSNCLSKISSNLDDPKICDLHSELLERDNCKLFVGKTNDNSESCSLIESQKIKNECLNHIGKSKGDLDICNQITDGKKKELCILSYAIENNDVQLCDSLEQSDFYQTPYKEMCLLGLSVKLNDKSLCDGIIKDTSAKDHCKIGDWDVVIGENDAVLTLRD